MKANNKIAIVGKTHEMQKVFESSVVKYGFILVRKNPDFVISYGGDGTFLKAERLYPGIPKIPVRHDSICKKCYANIFEEVADLLKQGKYKLKEECKIEVVFGKKKLVGINDVIIRNLHSNEAIRFSVKAGRKSYHNLIGDGIVCATPFGSTAYFESITRKNFKKGLGLAFNNTTKELKHLILDSKATIEFTLLRGMAELSSDNNPRILKLRKDSKAIIRLSDRKARIVEF